MVKSWKNRIKLLLILAITLSITYVGYNWYMRNTPEAKVRRLINNLSYYASRPVADKLPTMIMKNQGFGELFAPQSRLEFRAEMLNGHYTPQGLISWISRTRMYFKSLKLTIEDIEIDIISETEARAYFTGRATGVTKSGYDIDEVRDIESRIEKIDGNWKFKSLVSRQAMER